MSPVHQVEDEIIARLKERLPGRIGRIEPFPDRPSDFDFPDREAAVVLVHFTGADYAPAEGPRGAYSPRRTLKWSVVLLVRSLRGAEGGRIGAYEALDEIRRALQGVSFAGATAMVPKRETLDEEKAGVWRWALEFTCAIPAVAEAQFERDRFYSQPREEA
ncbi:Gp37 family protein [Xanthobacter sp. VTT E-85241]|uniref:Gp37 family protein n=1 Tax=Roseixanthobacter finlandensis TaxID=3119922 RepID=UPI00372ABEA7